MFLSILSFILKNGIPRPLLSRLTRVWSIRAPGIITLTNKSVKNKLKRDSKGLGIPFLDMNHIISKIGIPRPLGSRSWLNFFSKHWLVKKEIRSSHWSKASQTRGEPRGLGIPILDMMLRIKMHKRNCVLYEKT